MNTLQNYDKTYCTIQSLTKILIIVISPDKNTFPEGNIEQLWKNFSEVLTLSEKELFRARLGFSQVQSNILTTQALATFQNRQLALYEALEEVMETFKDPYVYSLLNIERQKGKSASWIQAVFREGVTIILHKNSHLQSGNN